MCIYVEDCSEADSDRFIFFILFVRISRDIKLRTSDAIVIEVYRCVIDVAVVFQNNYYW